MPQGLQCFDVNGNLILDITDRLTRVLGIFETGTSNGSLNDPNLANGAPWVYKYHQISTDIYNARPINVYVTGTTIYWEFDSARESQDALLSYGIVYGVF